MKNRRVTLFLLLVVVLALVSGSPLLVRLAYALLFLLLLGYFWAWSNVRRLEGQVQIITQHPQVGGWLEERLWLRNLGWLPKLLLEVRYSSDLPGHQNGRVVSLLPGGSSSWTVRTQCQMRGLYAFGPPLVVADDVFGLFSREWPLGKAQNILVYPATLELANFLLPSGDAPGEGAHRRPTQRVTPNASGIREYIFGDSVNRIHWRSTAHTGRLMVKEFELEPSGEIWVILDLYGPTQAGTGPESTEEYGVTIAASIVRKYLEANYSVGLMVSGDRGFFFPAQKGRYHQWRILEALAMVRAQGGTPVAELIAREGEKFGSNTTVVIITPSAQEVMAAPLHRFLQRRADVVTIVLDASTFGDQGRPVSAMDGLVSQGVETYLVRQGDDIGSALDSRIGGLR
ncbi:MAG: DUF58 domain-containing protein [Dehalococcoidia bacterium]